MPHGPQQQFMMVNDGEEDEQNNLNRSMEHMTNNRATRPRDTAHESDMHPKQKRQRIDIVLQHQQHPANNNFPLLQQLQTSPHSNSLHNSSSSSSSSLRYQQQATPSSHLQSSNNNNVLPQQHEEEDLDGDEEDEEERPAAIPLLDDLEQEQPPPPPPQQQTTSRIPSPKLFNSSSGLNSQLLNMPPPLTSSPAVMRPNISTGSLSQQSNASSASRAHNNVRSLPPPSPLNQMKSNGHLSFKSDEEHFQHSQHSQMNNAAGKQTFKKDERQKPFVNRLNVKEELQSLTNEQKDALLIQLIAQHPSHNNASIRTARDQFLNTLLSANSSVLLQPLSQIKDDELNDKANLRFKYKSAVEVSMDCKGGWCTLIAAIVSYLDQNLRFPFSGTWQNEKVMVLSVREAVDNNYEAEFHVRLKKSAKSFFVPVRAVKVDGTGSNVEVLDEVSSYLSKN